MLRAASPPPDGGAPVFAWAAEDFHVPAAEPTRLPDPWAVLSAGIEEVIDAALETAREALEPTDWSWDEPHAEAPADAGALFHAMPDWAFFVDLPAFDPRAREAEPFRPVVLPREESRAAKRARWLVDLLDVAEPRRRRRHIAFFEELFRLHPHVATFKALSGIALDEEPAAELLVEACRFRAHFLERPDSSSAGPPGPTRPA
jgi:alkylhydroperoxidase family enzyme